jgi:2-polyprenyl-3-methyl-5-hydroxy-6-metoxy-1,4-benzoquinol methylase
MKIIFPKRDDYPDGLGLARIKMGSSLHKELLESSASAYFETNFISRFFFKMRFKLAGEMIPLEGRKKMTILDAGCGIGFFLPTLCLIGRKIWAVDYAKYSLKYSKDMCQKKGLKNIFFKKSDLAASLPFRDHQFDLIVSLSVLEHIKDLDRVMMNFRRIMRRNGLLIVGYPNEDSVIFRIFQYLEKRLLRPKVYKIHQGTELIHVSRASKIDQKLKEYFYIEETKKISLIPCVDFYILHKCKIK